MLDHSSPLLLSVAILADDDALALQETLDSIAGLADEVLIVNAGMGEPLPAGAANSGVQIVAHCWNNDLSAARNACLAQIQGAWVLWLESGESLSAADAQALRAFLQKKGDRNCAYKLSVYVPPAPGGMAGEVAEQIRLAPCRDEVRFSGIVRENMTDSLVEAGMYVETLPQRIQCSDRSHDPARKARRAQRDLRLTQLAIEKDGFRPDWLNCAAEAQQILGDWRRAAELHRQAMELAERGSQEMLAAYYGLLTALDGAEQNVDAQLAATVEALAVFPSDIQLLCAMGGYLQAQRRSHLAAQAFHVAYTDGVVQPDLWHLEDARAVAGVCYSRLLETQGKTDRAVSFLAEAVAAHPTSPLLRRQLMEIHLRGGYTDAALALLDDMPLPDDQSAALRRAVIGACLARRECWSSAISYLHRAFLENCRDPLCLRWLAAALLATGKLEKAQIVLAEWRRIDPDCEEARSLLTTIQNRRAEAPSGGPVQARRVDESHGRGSAVAPTFPGISGTAAPAASSQRAE